jgi:hypothetical protein
LTPPRRGRRRLWLGALFALVAVGAIVYFATRGGSDGLAPISVAAAAERTSAEPGGSIETEITYTVAGESDSVVAKGAGTFDSRSGLARIELNVQGPDGSPVKVVTISDEKTAFVSSAVLSEQLPPGKAWLGMEPLLGRDPTTALSAGGGAKGSLEMLRAVGDDVERVGEETVRGENSTHYKASVDLAREAKTFAAKGDAGLARLYKEIASRIAGPIAVEVWIGVGGLVRRERLLERVPTEDGKTLELHLAIEFFDFAPHPDIKPPAQDLVLDYTPVLRAELGMLDGTGIGSLRPPRGAAPLSVSEFRHQATAICRATLVRGNKLPDEGGRLGRKLGALSNSGATLSEIQPVILELGRWLEDFPYRWSSAEIAELAALAPPPEYAADFHRYLTIYAEEAEWELAEARAFQSGHAQALDNSKHEAEHRPELRELARILPRLGIMECGKDFESGSTSAAA